MKYSEADYINAGFAYEKGRKAGETLRKMLEAEAIDERTEARRLIERGRAEARLTDEA
jgi:hypothetical protein